MTLGYWSHTAQCATIHFAMSHEGQFCQKENVCRNHIVRQPLMQIFLQGKGCYGCIRHMSLPHTCSRLTSAYRKRCGFCNYIGHQVSSGLALLSQQNHCLLYPRIILQSRFNFAQFDAIPPQFHLAIHTPYVFNVAICPIARQISCPVETRSWMSTGRRLYPAVEMRQKALGSQLWLVLVSTCYSQSCNGKFSDDANGHRVPIAVQNREPSIGNRGTNADDACLWITGFYLVDTTAHHGLCRPILVDEACLLCKRAPTSQTRGLQGLTANDKGIGHVW